MRSGRRVLSRWPGGDDCLGRFYPAVAGHADHRDLVYPRERGERLFDLGGIDVLAAADDSSAARSTRYILPSVSRWPDRRFRRRESSYLERWTTPPEQLYPDRSRQELRSVASAAIGMLMSVTGWPSDALRTPNLPDLLAELAVSALTLAPVHGK
jgi:hypothetical protein